MNIYDTLEYDEMLRRDWAAEAADPLPSTPLHEVTIEQGLGKWLVYVSDVTAPHGRTMFAMVNSLEDAQAEQERANVRYNYRCQECQGDVRKCDCLPF